MRPWQNWYAQTYPDRPAAELPSEDLSKWDFDQLVEYLDSDQGKFGDPVRGRTAYTKAQCASCHQFGNYGDVHRRTGQAITVPELYGYARDDLHVDYLFWSTEEPFYSRDVLPHLRD